MISLYDVLLSASNIPVSDPIAEIWGRGLQGGYKIIEYTGSLPITINANGDVLLDYRIYGNTVQSGTPTPENPIIPNGCGERTENLFDKNFEQGFYRTNDGGKSISLRYVRSNDKIPVSPDETYTVTYTCPKEGVTQSRVGRDSYIFFWEADSSYIGYQQIMEKRNQTFTTPSNAAYVGFIIGAGFMEGATLTPSDVSNFMLNSSSTALPYEPYGYKLPMTVSDSQAAQTVPVYIGENQLDSVEGVSDYVDKASGKIVRHIKEYTFTGDEQFNMYGGINESGFFTQKNFFDADVQKDVITTRFSHFTARSNTALGTLAVSSFGDDCACFRAYVGNENVMLRSTSKFTTVEECKAYFKTQYDNGTPVKMWYIMKTHIEEDPPVPLPEIPTIDGTTIIDYDGDPKPSQMYVEYKGKDKDKG